MKYATETKQVGKLAYPLLLNYLLTTLFEIIDEAIVGHYSVDGFALVGIAASIIFSVTGALGILSSAFNILAANKKGKKDEKGFEELFISSKGMSIAIGIVFIVISVLCGRFFFRSIYGVKGHNLNALLSYFYPASITVLQNMLIFQYSSYFRNKLNSRISLWVTIVSTGVNLFFDYSLVYGRFGLPSIGISGAAWGSVIGLFAGLFIYQITCYKDAMEKKTVLGLSVNGKNIRENIKDIMKLYTTLLGQEVLECTIFVLVVSAVVARMGTTQMAVYKMLDIVIASLSLPAYAFATAAQTHALQEHAAKLRKHAITYLKVGISLGIAMVFLLGILTVIFKGTVFGWIIEDRTIISLAGNYLWLVLGCVLLKVPYQMYMSFLQGIEKDKYVFLWTAVSTVVGSMGVIFFGMVMKLTGIYVVMLLQYGMIGLLYREKSIREKV